MSIIKLFGSWITTRIFSWQRQLCQATCKSSSTTTARTERPKFFTNFLTASDAWQGWAIAPDLATKSNVQKLPKAMVMSLFHWFMKQAKQALLPEKRILSWQVLTCCNASNDRNLAGTFHFTSLEYSQSIERGTAATWLALANLLLVWAEVAPASSTLCCAGAMWVWKCSGDPSSVKEHKAVQYHKGS